MADVPLNADVELDISAALSQVSRLEAALASASEVRLTADASEVTSATTSAVEAADTDVLVDADASAVTSATTAAVNDADTLVEVEGDASQVTGEVTNAVDNADTNVQVTGDASQVTGAVDSAVDAADTDVALDVDDSSIRQAASSADELSGALLLSSRRGLELRSVLQVGALAAAAEGIRRVVLAASELEQAVGGTTAIFGPAEAEVVSFARGAAEAAGLTETAARTLTSQLGGLLQGFGFAQQEAAETSVILAQLGADLAATFGGTSVEAVEALGAALRGEFDPLERFGISLNITRANLKAVELGLASSTNEVDLNARAQASLALIMEASANAQGQFAREATTTAGLLERAQAEAGNAAAAVGRTLQPAINDLIGTLRTEGIPALQDLGEELGPSLVTSVNALLPLLGSATSLLSALSPVAEVVAQGLDAIPDPVLQAVAAFLLLRRLGAADVLRGIGSAVTSAALSVGHFTERARTAGSTALAAQAHFGSFRGATAGLRGAMSGLNAAISPNIIATAGLTAGLLLLSQAQQASAERAAQQRQRVETLAEALREADSAAEGLADGFEALVDEGDPVAENIVAIGLSGDRLARQMTDAESAVDAMIVALASTGDVSEDALEALRGLGGETQAVRTHLRAAQDGAAQADRAISSLSDETLEAAVALLDFASASDDAIRSELDNAVAAGQMTDALRDQILAADNVAGAYGEWLTELEATTREQERAINTQIAAAEAQGKLTESQADSIRATEDLNEREAQLNEALAEQISLMGVADEFLASYEGAAGRAADQNSRLVEVLNAAGLALSTISDIQSLVEGGWISATAAESALTTQTDTLHTSLVNLALAIDAAQLSGEDLEQIAGGLGVSMADLEFFVGSVVEDFNGFVSAVQGSLPTISDALGELDNVTLSGIGEALDSTLEDLQQFNEDLGLLSPFPQLQRIAAEQGPETAAVLADAVRQGKEGMLGEWEATATGIQTEQDTILQQAIAVWAPAFALAMAQAAGLVAEAFGADFDLEEVTERILEATEATAGAHTSSFRSRGVHLGRGITDGASSGVAPLPGRVGSAVDSAVGAVTGAIGGASSSGRAVGSAIGDGMAGGVRSRRGSVVAAVGDIVAAATAAAQDLLGIFSPSRVFHGFGSEVGEGLALGIESTQARVESAVAGLSSAATAPISTVEVDPQIAGLAGGATGTQTVIHIGREAVVINVPAGATPTQARQTGEAAARGFLTTVAQRQVFVDARVA